jgi:ankyrin repeat protein
MTISPAYPAIDVSLLQAAASGETGKAGDLIDQGAEVDCQGEHDGRTPLHMAALNGQRDTANLLLNKGATREIFDNAGDTPLMAASHDKALGAAAYLLAANADTDAQDKTGETALMKAAKNNQPGAVEALIKGFADICMKDNNHRTAFGLAKDAKAGAALVALYPHVEANDREKTYAMAQKLRPTNKISVGKPLKFRKPGGA